jgi:hypothetical protein
MANKDRGLSREEIERETRRLAADLAFAARAPVNIQLVGGSHIAFTYGTDESMKQHQIPVVMNPDTLKTVRNKEQAIKIWRGIGVHELLHHLHPAGTQYKAAEKEGFRHLFNLVDDEQNERRGRAMDPTWGAYLQAVCAHVFSHKKRKNETLSPGIIDGEKEGRKPRGIAAHNIYGQRWNLFAFHFRRHIPNCQDEVVAEALALIPKRFMDLSKEELLDLTRQIHLILARGLELPEQPEQPDPAEQEEPEEEEEKKEPEQPDAGGDGDAEKGKDEEPAEDAHVVKDGWSIKRMLKSKWMFVPFAGFIIAWTVLLLQADVDFWVQVAGFCVLAVALIIGFLFLRRAYIKSLLERAKAAASARARPPGAPPGKVHTALRSKQFGYVVAALFFGGVCYLLYLLSGFIGLPLVGIIVEILVLGLAVWAAGKLSKKRKEQNKELSPKAVAALSVVAVLALVGLLLTMHSMGFSLLLILPLGVVLGGGVGVALLIIFHKDKEDDPLGYRRESFSRKLRRILREKWEDFWGAIWRGIKAAGRFIGDIIGAICRFIVKCAIWVWGWIVRFAKFVAYVTTRFYWKIEPTLTVLWRNAFFRLAVVSLPVAAILVMLYAVAVTAGRTSPWLLVALIVLLLLLLLLFFLFRKQIRKFVVSELFMPMPSLMDMNMPVPLDMETEWFVQIDNEQPIEPDQAFLDEHMPALYALAQQLRPYLKRCGRQIVDREDQPEGYDLIDEAELALVGETSVFVDDEPVSKSSLHLEIALDCSSSMNSATQSLKPGEKFLLGKIFALLLEQATINLPGVSAHFWGFTHDRIYDCGVPGEGRISGLQCGGGNNDAAMLWHMGQSAAASGKDVKILIMLSDGQPSECSWLSLHNLVLQFEQEGMIPWNFALDVIQIPAFERFFTDLVGQTMEEAVITMGETLASIAQEGV